MNIAHIAYINLPHRTDKLQNIEHQLSFCPYPRTKIDGVIINDLSLYPVVPFLKQDEKAHKGAVGCFLAHKKAISILMGMQLDANDYSFIIEDDIYIDKNFWQLLPTIENYIDNADILFFDAASKLSPYGIFPKVNNTYPVSYLIDKTANPIIQLSNNHKKLCFHGAHCVAIQNKKLSYIYDILNSVKLYNHVDIYYLNNLSAIEVEAGLVYQQRDLLSSDSPLPKAIKQNSDN